MRPCPVLLTGTRSAHTGSSRAAGAGPRGTCRQAGGTALATPSDLAGRGQVSGHAHAAGLYDRLVRELEAGPAGRPGGRTVRRVGDAARLAAVIGGGLTLIAVVMVTGRFAVAAHFADGSRGTFTVEDVFCGGPCTWQGIFRDRQDPTGFWVTLASGPGQTIKGAGHQVPAIYVGGTDQVYPPGGGSEWAEVQTFLIAISVFACCLMAAVLALRYRRSRRCSHALATG